MFEKKARNTSPPFPFWLSTKEDSLFPNDRDYEIKKWRLSKLGEVPYPEKFKNKLVRLFKMYGFKDPLNQIYVPFYLKYFGGKIIEGEYDYSEVDWEHVYMWYFLHMIVNFTELGEYKNEEKFLNKLKKLKKRGIPTSYHPSHINDFSEWG